LLFWASNRGVAKCTKPLFVGWKKVLLSVSDDLTATARQYPSSDLREEVDGQTGFLIVATRYYSMKSAA
jgi:hypothetical protein